MLRRLPAQWILMAPGLLILIFFFLLPVGQLLLFSFFHTTPDGLMEKTFVLEQYFAFFKDPHYLMILWRTIVIGVTVSVICLILGYCLAYGVARSNPKNKYLLLLLIALPLLTSAVIRNFGWIVILGRKGLINQVLMNIGLIDKPLDLLYTSTGVVIAMVHVLLPFMVLVLYSVLDGMDRNLESAAANLGASPSKVFWFVTLPLSLPGIVAGTLLVFSISISFYITPALIGGPRVQVMATEIYNQTIHLMNWPFASALAVILLVTVFIITSLYNRALSRSSSQGAGII
ncbi:ABC transporter permease [Paenibacillus eucommiae]|uniref:Spermidine/putrescine transport system permease protein n=1 Tax=Paenibacillus eucommiae TaxID=1355755 RepID=A0ABS4IR11_9BACL|nr:ABC transporter permease [Paenibacillus eucommiae]MBP1990008.1 putative spermidine/putrescine transport system permease protein [Paenibacillus eucommiae]